MKRTITYIVLILTGYIPVLLGCARPDFRDSSLPSEQRAELLLQELTLEEKIFFNDGCVETGRTVRYKAV